MMKKIENFTQNVIFFGRVSLICLFQSFGVFWKKWVIWKDGIITIMSILSLISRVNREAFEIFLKFGMKINGQQGP